ncbi:MAG: hypothetical protein ACT4PT_10605, partial [Methanobacteriota archaeon]
GAPAHHLRIADCPAVSSLRPVRVPLLPAPAGDHTVRLRCLESCGRYGDAKIDKIRLDGGGTREAETFVAAASTDPAHRVGARPDVDDGACAPGATARCVVLSHAGDSIDLPLSFASASAAPVLFVELGADVACRAARFHDPARGWDCESPLLPLPATPSENPRGWRGTRAALVATLPAHREEIQSSLSSVAGPGTTPGTGTGAATNASGHAAADVSRASTTEYTDLRLSITHSLAGVQFAEIRVAYGPLGTLTSNPASQNSIEAGLPWETASCGRGRAYVSSAGVLTDAPVATWDFCTGTLNEAVAEAPLSERLQRGWRTDQYLLDPYLRRTTGLAAWDSGALALDFYAGFPFRHGDAVTYGGWFIDDVVLTGIPLGGSEADRRVLLSTSGIRGTEIGDWRSVPETNVIASSGAWDRFGLQGLANLHEAAWRFGELTPGGPLTWVHQADSVLTRHDGRLVTPPIRLEGATDPVLRFHHKIATRVDIDESGTVPRMTLHEVGLVEIQVKTDDGWSPFYPLEPDGGYPRPFDEGRDHEQGNPELVPGNGFYHPEGFYTDIRDDRGNLTTVVARGSGYQEVAIPLRSQLSLFAAGLDPAGREVRFAFHFLNDRNDTTVRSAMERSKGWWIGPIRVLPQTALGTDVAATSVRLATSYPYRELGVGPNGTVPVEVEIENRGLFPAEDLEATID